MINLIQHLVGSRVVVRSRGSGVWLGELLAAEDSSVSLKAARRAHYWEGAGSCSGLAAIGPTGGRIAIPVDVVVNEVVEILPASQEALKAWDSQPVWTGRE